MNDNHQLLTYARHIQTHSPTNTITFSFEFANGFDLILFFFFKKTFFFLPCLLTRSMYIVITYKIAQEQREKQKHKFHLLILHIIIGVDFVVCHTNKKTQRRRKNRLFLL